MSDEDPIHGLVSTIIPVYNRAGMIHSTVQSVLDQTYRQIEIILVDDGSTDGTLAELHSLAEQTPDVVRVAHRENGGPGLARETGRLLARGEFIQYFDSDDLLLRRKFEVQVAALRANPDCGIAYGISNVIDQEGNTLKDVCKWTDREMDGLFPALLVNRWWNTHTPLYRRTLCDRIGAWTDKRPEDWDYDARAGALGARLIFCDEVFSCQRQHDGPCVTKWSMESYWPQEASFLPRLYQCSVKAGVSSDAHEMRHFARWVFTHIRRAVKRGDIKSAKELLPLAQMSGRSMVDIKVYRLLTSVLGWRIATDVFEGVWRTTARGVGKYSLRQSWEDGGKSGKGGMA
jgi:glycosyltransferase involved in cell wall biosynthesis